MKVLVVGSGGREHALAWRLAGSESVDAVLCAPGNPGTAEVATNLDAANVNDIVAAVEEHDVDLTVVGPETLLVEGLVDRLADAGRLACGPSAAAGRLEGSKVFAKEFMRANDIPTARYQVATDETGVREAVAELGLPVVLKADGLAAGKGVLIVDNSRDLEAALSAFFAERRFGSSGDTVVVEEFLTGEEVSFIALCDGRRALPWAASKDYKRIDEGDTGLNTGGMGAHSPDGFLDDEQAALVRRLVMQPTLDAMAAAGSPFRGFLYAGLILTSDGPRVLEFNVRLGDPEAQPLLMRFQGDLGEVLTDAARGDLDAGSFAFSDQAAACVVLATDGYPTSPRTGDPIQGLDGARELGALVFQAGSALENGKLVTAGGRVLNVCGQGETIAEALELAYRGADAIGFEGMQLRRDLGARVTRAPAASEGCPPAGGA